MAALVKHIVGLDLGQARDFSALAVLSRTEGPSRYPCYDVRHVQRFPLGMSYPQIVGSASELLRSPKLAGCTFVVDQTGVGRAVVDMFRAELRGSVECRFLPVTITAGKKVCRGESGLRVPKRQLVKTLKILLQSRRLRIAQSLVEARALLQELETFAVKITEAANEVFSAWLAGDHDDLVLAVALAACAGELESAK